MTPTSSIPFTLARTSCEAQVINHVLHTNIPIPAPTPGSPKIPELHADPQAQHLIAQLQSALVQRQHFAALEAHRTTTIAVLDAIRTNPNSPQSTRFILALYRGTHPSSPRPRVSRPASQVAASTERSDPNTHVPPPFRSEHLTAASTERSDHGTHMPLPIRSEHLTAASTERSDPGTHVPPPIRAHTAHRARPRDLATLRAHSTRHTPRALRATRCTHAHQRPTIQEAPILRPKIARAAPRGTHRTTHATTRLAEATGHPSRLTSDPSHATSAAAARGKQRLNARTHSNGTGRGRMRTACQSETPRSD